MPGAGNVIPGRVMFSLDIRAEDDALRDRTFDAIHETLERIADDRVLTLSCDETHSAPAVKCASRLQAALSDAIEHIAPPVPTLFSGAGHDGMAMAAITDIGMLFLRCQGGISHHPDESVMVGDIDVAFDALGRAVMSLAAQHDEAS